MALASVALPVMPWLCPASRSLSVCKSAARSPVNSRSTRTAPPENVRISIMSRAVMLVSMKCRAAAKARIWSETGMAVRSKYKASRRRSRYTAGSGGATAPRALVAGGAETAPAETVGEVTGAIAAGASGVADSWSSWYSQILMVCGFPSSVRMKSLEVRPPMGLPFLSLTLTVRITSCVLLENVVWPGGWAFATRAARSSRKTWRMKLEVEAKRGLDTAHVISRSRQTKLRAGGDNVPACERNVIQRVHAIHAKIEIHSVLEAERSAQGGIPPELA